MGVDGNTPPTTDDEHYPAPPRREPPIELDIGAPDGKLTNEQRTRLEARIPEAHRLIQDIEDRMVALTVAATARWSPDQSLLDTDENSAPVMGDDEYADFLSMVEDMAEHAMFRAVALFMGLPQPVVDATLTESLRNDFVDSAATLKKSAQPFVVRRTAGGPGPNMTR